MASGVSTDSLDCDEGGAGRGTVGGGGRCRKDGSHDVTEGSSGTGGTGGSVGADCVVLTVMAPEFGVDERVDDWLDDSVVGVIGRMNAADNGWTRTSTQSSQYVLTCKRKLTFMFPHIPTISAPFSVSFIQPSQ
jgi:hypothetical protein